MRLVASVALARTQARLDNLLAPRIPSAIMNASEVADLAR
jgi:hypothetical protein